MMKLTDSVLLRFKYNDSVLTIRVPLTKNLTWGWVAREVLRLHLIMKDENFNSNIKKCSVLTILSPERDAIDLTQRILYYDIIRMVCHPGEFVLFVEGLWSTLDPKLFYKIGQFIHSAKDISSLQLVSKRFHFLFTADNVWENIAFTCCVWQGSGHMGNEEEEWKIIKETAGLGIMGTFRLRWMAHNASRLKLFYGSVKSKFSDFFIHAVYPRNVVFILGEAHNNVGMNGVTKDFMEKIHYIIPESATCSHLSSSMRPLLRKGILLDVEPSPVNSRSRNLPRDPGTRVECSITDTSFKFRRVGDNRLAMIGMDLPPLGPRRDFRFDLYFELTANVRKLILKVYLTCLTFLFQTICNILLVNYDSLCAKRMERSIEELWEALQYQFGANTTAHCQAWESCKEQRFKVSETPVLIFLYIDWTKWVPLGVDPQLYLACPGLRVGISEAVRTVHCLFQKLTANARYQHRPRSWYIQPIDACAPQRKLSNGFLAGINWLLRATGSK